MTSSFGSVSAAAAANTHISNPLLRTAAVNSESLTETAIQGRTKNKFQNGFLGGVGSTSQFQGAMTSLPVMPFNTNNDLAQRITSSVGYSAQTSLQPSWKRSYAFAPGLGIDAYRSKITWTDEEAGRDQITGVVGPQTHAGVDRFEAGPVPQDTTYQGLGANTQAPVVITGGEGATIAEKILASQKTTRSKAR